MNAQDGLPALEDCKKEGGTIADCKEMLLASRDVMELLSGKWKIRIIACLVLSGTLRFMDLLRLVDGIGTKMLSKELQELEQNELISRKVVKTKPMTVEYELTDHGKTLRSLIHIITSWGISHRQFLFKHKQ